MMKNEKLQKVRELLVLESNRIQRALAGVSQKDTKGIYEPSYPDYGKKEDENAAEVSDFSKNITIEANLQTLLEQTNKAIAKIDSGIYGVCNSCGNKIPQGRLDAYPSALLCVECQEKADKNG